MTENFRPYISQTGRKFRYWWREVGPFGPWASEFSFDAGRTWHRFMWAAFSAAMEAGELQPYEPQEVTP